MAKNAWGDEEVSVARNEWGDVAVRKPVESAPIDADPAKGMSPLQKFTVGAGAAFDRATSALATMFPAQYPGIPQVTKDDAEAYKRHHPGGWATAGEVAADIGMSAIPVMKGGKVLSKTLGSSAVAPTVAGDVAANAIYSAATTPEDRALAALLGGGGAAAGKVLSKTLGSGPTRVTPEAQKMLDAGIPLTPGQAGGGLSHTLETLSSGYPLAGSAIKKAQEEARREWTRQATTRVFQQAPDSKGAHALLKSLARIDPLGQKGVTPTQMGRISASPALHDPTNFDQIALRLADEARRGMPILGKEGLDTRLPLIPSVHVLSALLDPTKAAAATVLPVLYGSPWGRSFLMGKMSWQEFILKHPEEAALVGRAIADQFQPQEATQ